MDPLLLAAATVVGGLVGAGLDPVGQRLAQRGRAEEDARRAGEEPRPEGDVEPGSRAAVGPPRRLVPSGPSTGRTAVSAVVTGVLFGVVASRFGTDLILAPLCVFVALLVVVSVTDLSHRLVPRRLLYPALTLIVPLLVATAAVDHRWDHLVGAGVAGATAFGLFAGIWWFVPQGIGFGDVRLAGVIGVTVGYLSLLAAYLAFAGGFVIGLLMALPAMVAQSSAGKARIPFAPSLAAGAVAALVWGGPTAISLVGGRR